MLATPSIIAVTFSAHDSPLQATSMLSIDNLRVLPPAARPSLASHISPPHCSQGKVPPVDLCANTLAKAAEAHGLTLECAFGAVAGQEQDQGAVEKGREA